MTPDDAAIRADVEAVKFCPHIDWQTNRCSACRSYRLAKALEAAWAERDARYTGQELKLERINRKNAEKRAERAEALNDRRMRAADHYAKQAERAWRANEVLKLRLAEEQAALARVRALCDRWERHGKPHPDYIVGDVRAAIEGDNQ